MGGFGGCGDVITWIDLKNILFYDIDYIFFGDVPSQVIPLMIILVGFYNIVLLMLLWTFIYVRHLIYNTRIEWW